MWELKQAIDPLPPATRRAMLVGVQANPIIAGAYTSRFGGICPMLAAHRLGAESDGGAFAQAWDSFTGARWPRPARERELEQLALLLEQSLLPKSGAGPAPFYPSNGHGPAPAANGRSTANGSSTNDSSTNGRAADLEHAARPHGR